MADPNANVLVAPSDDASFMSASPEERHAYLSSTDPSYASASPEEQKAYLQHQVTQGAQQNIAKYPKSDVGNLTPEQYTALPAEQRHAYESKPRNLMQEVGEALPQPEHPMMRALGAVEKHVNQPLNRATEAGAEFGANAMERGMLTRPGGMAGVPLSPEGPDQFNREEAEKEFPTLAGASRAIGGTLGGMVADPRQLLLMVGSMGSAEALPVLQRVASAGFATQMGYGAKQELGNLITNWDNLTPAQRAESITKLGIDTTFTAMAGAHASEGVPAKIGENVKPVAQRTVRMAGRGIENASRPIVAGPAIGGAIGKAVGAPGVGAAIGEGAAWLHPRPMEPMIRVPGMTEFGMEKPIYPGAPLPENPANALGTIPPTGAQPEEKVLGQELSPKQEQPVDKGLEFLKSAYDKANQAYQKAYEARDAYKASEAQGVAVPKHILTAFEKAQKALDEAQYHLEAAEEARKTQPVQSEQENLTNPPVVRGGQQELPGGGVMGKPLQLQGEVAPAPQGPQNVKRPGEIAPETETPTAVRMRRDNETAQQPEGMPVIRGGQQELPNQQGVMGRPLQLPGEVPQPPKTTDQVKKIGDLTRQGLGGTELQANKPLREQLPAVKEQPVQEVLPPEPIQAQPEEPKTIEAEVEHPRNLVHANGEALANSIPKTAEGRELLQKLHDLSNVELRQLAINAGEDMGQSKIGRGKASGNVTRDAVFQRLLKSHTAEDLGRMVDEGKHQPIEGEVVPAAPKAETAQPEAPKEEATGKINEEAQAAHEKYNEHKAYAETLEDPEERADFLKAARISRDNKLAQLGQGGGATLAPATSDLRGANTEEAVAKENDWFDQAKREKPDATVSEQLQYAQELKNKAQEPKRTELSHQEIADWHNKHRGFSYNPKEGMIRDQNVYSVAGEHPELDKVIKGQKITPEDIKQFMEDPKVKEVLDSDPRNNVGGWFHKGASHLEVSKMFHDRDEAISEGKRLNQNEIYDHANREGIPTGGTAGDEAAAKAEAPKASMETARMTDEQLKERGFTQQDIEEGKHLPSVSGAAISKREAKRLAEEHLTDEEKAGVTKTEKGNKSFIDKMMSMPSVREVTDIAQAGEGSRKWYQRSQQAIQHMADSAPDYFNKEGDVDKFTGLLAASSPRQSVAMNIRETLNAWKNYVDAGRPTGKALEKLLRDNFVNAGGKVPNAMKALAGEPMWPDLTKNRAFKVPSFRDNLSGILNRVTNDGWMALFSGLTPEELSSPNSYHPISVITREAAKQLGWEPAEAQAAIWSFVKTFVDKAGLHDPQDIRHFSEDMADIVKHDPETRQILEGLKVNLNELDNRIKSIGPKPEITSGNSPTLKNSIGKLAKRIEGARGEAPTPKDSGLFDNPVAKNDEGDTSFNPDELSEVTPKATAATARMSNADLLEHGFTQEDIDAGKHLPEVGGGSQEADKEENPIWYSKAAKIAEEKLGGKGSGAQILATLKNNGVKGDELEYTGLEDFLTGPGTEGQKFSKQDVTSYIKDNGIKLSETTHGEPDPGFEEKHKKYQEAVQAKNKAEEDYGNARDKIMGIFDPHVNDTNFSVWDLLNNDRDRRLAQIAPQVDTEGIKTIRGQQTSMFGAPEDLPRRAQGRMQPMHEYMGAKSQPWPAEDFNKLQEALKEYDAKGVEYRQLNSKVGSMESPSKYSVPTKFDKWTLGHKEGMPKENYKEKLIQIPVKEGERPFVHTLHFSEPNIVAHARYDDRVDADGKKNLFLEELQSDLHRTGHESGYRGQKGITAERTSEYPNVPERDRPWVLKNAKGEKVGEVPAWYNNPEEAIKAHQQDAIHDAPFKNDWHEMALKRMLREAVEKGYDRMSWTTGKQQADRYSLAKHVDEIHYDPESKTLVAYQNGYQKFNKIVDPKELAGTVGKDVADKLLSQKPEPIKATVEMDDSDTSYPYKVMIDGAEHDRFGSSYAAEQAAETLRNKPAKSTVKGTDLEIGGNWAKALYDRAIPNFLNKYLKKFNVKVGETELKMPGHGYQGQERTPGPKVHSVDITPEMKKEFMKGQPIAEMEEETDNKAA